MKVGRLVLVTLLVVSIFILTCQCGKSTPEQEDQISKNLIQNPCCEDVLVDGEVPYWTEAVGTSWTQRTANPDPYEGTAYFFAGVVANAELSQMVDVSTFAAAIDSGTQQFTFKGYVRSFNQSPADSSKIILEYLDDIQAEIQEFDSGDIINKTSWQMVSDTRFAPMGTRWIRIRLISTRYSGSNNDGYYDALSLYAN